LAFLIKIGAEAMSENDHFWEKPPFLGGQKSSKIGHFFVKIYTTSSYILNILASD